MHHTALDERSLRLHSPRRLLGGLPIVALAALGVAFGCSSDEGDASRNTTPVFTPAPSDPAAPLPSAPAVTDGQPAPSDDIDRVDEGTPGGDIDLEGGGESPAGGGAVPAGEEAETPVQPPEGTPPEATPPEAAPPEGTPAVAVPPVFVEDDGTDCQIPALPAFGALQPLTTLPDPFLGLNGQRITTRAEWRCRRQEIKQLAERFIYGEKPVAPESVTGTVTATAITVNVQNQGRTVSFGATITLPPGATGPVPAIIGYGGSGFQNAILAEGVAFINYNVDAVGDETTNNPKAGAFYDANPDRQDTGMLLAWAWGVSRMLDVIEASPQIIDPTGVGVHGCSRSGKGAFIAGAFDQRVALTIPLESGMAGVPAFRMIVPEGGEVLRNAIQYRPWAGNGYQQFLQLTAAQTDTAGLDRDNQASGQLQFRLPVDTHEVIGLVAPRGLLVMGNPSIVNLAPRSENITVQAGAEIYSALGVPENLSYTSSTTNGTHCAFRQEYVPQLQQNIRKFLKKDATATTGAREPDARVAADAGPSIAWQTPALQ